MYSKNCHKVLVNESTEDFMLSFSRSNVMIFVLVFSQEQRVKNVYVSSHELSS